MAPLGSATCSAPREDEESLAKLLGEEEIKWAQRDKVRDVRECGINTKFFHLIANKKHGKKKIGQVEQDKGTIVDQENLKSYISEFSYNLLPMF